MESSAQRDRDEQQGALCRRGWPGLPHPLADDAQYPASTIPRTERGTQRTLELSHFPPQETKSPGKYDLALENEICLLQNLNRFWFLSELSFAKTKCAEIWVQHGKLVSQSP